MEQPQKDTKTETQAGTGFMQQPREGMQQLEKEGYSQNFVPRFDHFEVHDGKEKIYPEEFEVDKILRFENTSDPEDQSILYAISSSAHGLRGTFLESYGIYHEELSAEMRERLQNAKPN